ncbi:bleomycin hydrolase [Diorhabda carinulata]|uniref:bleomycin hydrolase n=1 Tax=Diorhabda sublineata TaxID=1163346 RepID=UPI0024E18886|nr:bleomycin hydrolase [Diorhabda sublineata]XP_057671057.1 bleomycin hydrolase [Diorhabda carinulata]XP_057671058.1 bleomycin hydrolase [Diorhabda carinulata]
MDSNKSVQGALDEETLSKFRKEFYAEQKNLLAQNVCTKTDPFEVALKRKTLEETQHVFNHKIEAEGKPVTNQRSSGRCWLFAALNVVRLPFIKHFNIEDFEFSQAYLFFWDKIERCNNFLNNIVLTARRNEAVDGRLVSFLLNDPTSDGGQWDMLVNLINKHGLMPKKNFPESFSCEQSVKMNQILKSKLREYARAIRELISKGGSDADIQHLISDQMGNIYRIVGICLGIPNETFIWSYYDKNKAYHSIGPITPKQFYEQHVKPHFNVDDKVCLVTDPRPTNEYGKCYTVDCLGNMVGGRKCIYNNQPVDLLLDLTAKSIKEGEAVWFGCEVSKRYVAKQGIQDLKAHDFPLVFGVDIQVTLSKADRLLYSESAMTHAMVFTAVNTNDAGEVTKLRVENSWGEDRGEKGYLIMTSDWFKEFTFEVVVDKKYVPQDVLDVFKQEPIVLPAWDPMGTLAN